ncbi:MAG: hypothetical protein WC284_10180 [Candidimonas sp.]
MIEYHKIIQPKKEFDLPTFRHEDIGMKGINGEPFVVMDDHIGLTEKQWEEIDYEIGIGIATNETAIPGGIVFGEIPPKLVNEVGGLLEPQIMNNIESLDPDGRHRDAMRKMTRHQRQKYAYMVLGSVPIWHQLIYIRNYNMPNSKCGTYDAEWTDEGKKLFPKTIEFMKSMPMEYIGRVLIFCSYPSYPVPPHRDWIQSPHRDHHINFTSKKNRPIYMYDEIKNEKYYLDPNARSYLFNLRDYHGVDGYPRYAYTLKIEGMFDKSLQEKLNLKEGFLWTPEVI